MNLILISDNDAQDRSGHVRLTGRRQKHILEIHRAKAGDELCVGMTNGKIGKGRIVALDKTSVVLDVQLTDDPPQPLPLTLILALPRPQVIKRTLLCASSLGIKRIVLLNFYRVEKSLWQSSSLDPSAIHEQLVLGLEQARDTLMPVVELRKSFKKFVDDELPSIIRGTLPLVAHPGSESACPQNVLKPVTLIIGPEGGLIDHELDTLVKTGFRPVDLGPRILRVESFLPFVVGKLF